MWLRFKILFLFGVIVVVGLILVPVRRGIIREHNIADVFSSSARQMLDNNEKFILYSLYPSILEGQVNEFRTNSKFHEYPILGLVEIKQKDLKGYLVTAIYNALGADQAAGCFNPRHGIRVTRGKEAVDLVICFSCQQIEVYEGNHTSYGRISLQPKQLFNDVLTMNHIPLPPQ